MTASANTELPPDSELVVPQELTLSTPWLKAIVVYMGAKCEKEMNVSCFLINFYFNSTNLFNRNLCFYDESMEMTLERS